MANLLGKWNERKKNINAYETGSPRDRDEFFANCTVDDLKRITKKSKVLLGYIIKKNYFSLAIQQYHQFDITDKVVANIVNILRQDKKLLQWVLKAPIQFNVAEEDLKAGFHGSKPKDPFYRIATRAYNKANSRWTRYKERRYPRWHKGKPHPDAALNALFKNSFDPALYINAQHARATEAPTPKRPSPKRRLIDSFNASDAPSPPKESMKQGKSRGKNGDDSVQFSPLPASSEVRNNGNHGTGLDLSHEGSYTSGSEEDDHAELDDTNASRVMASGGRPFKPANDSILGSGRRGNTSRVGDSPSLHPSRDLGSPAGGAAGTSELPSFQSVGGDVKAVDVSSELPSFN